MGVGVVYHQPHLLQLRKRTTFDTRRRENLIHERIGGARSSILYRSHKVYFVLALGSKAG